MSVRYSWFIALCKSSTISFLLYAQLFYPLFRVGQSATIFVDLSIFPFNSFIFQHVF